MALYIKDLELEKAKKIVSELSDTNEKDKLILYYINKLEKENQELIEETNEFRNFFKILGKFLPNKQIYG
jgi:hypothetical protein